MGTILFLKRPSNIINTLYILLSWIGPRASAHFKICSMISISKAPQLFFVQLNYPHQ